MQPVVHRFRRIVAVALLMAVLPILPNAEAQPEPGLAQTERVADAAPAAADPLSAPRWSPYAVGLGIGVLSWLAFLLSDHPLGVSTAFAKTAGMIEKAVRGPSVLQKPYYQETKPGIDWEWMLVIGLFMGALTAAWFSGTIQWEWVPPMWAGAFGDSVLPRIGVAVIGGICVGFGARWGCGCTSGHGISGTMQLVLASWLSAGCFFIGGIASAMLLYRVF